MSTDAQIPPEKPLLYSQVRDQIQDGDVILFQGERQLSTLIRQFSHAAYSHAGLVLTWYGRRILVSAELPKTQALPLGLSVVGYPGRVDWYRLRPASRAALNVERLALEALVNLGVEYGASTLFKLAGHFTLGLPTHKSGDAGSDESQAMRSLICSQYVSRCLRAGGVDLSGQADIDTDPGEIARSPQLEFVGTLKREINNVEQARAEKAF